MGRSSGEDAELDLDLYSPLLSEDEVDDIDEYRSIKEKI
jgi:hypothetical protein